MKTFGTFPFFLFIGIVTFFSNFDKKVEEKTTEDLFKAYINTFKQASFPYIISQKTQGIDFNDIETVYEPATTINEINHKYLMFIPDHRPRYSRMPPETYEYQALLASNDEFVAVIVKASMPYSHLATTYKLITYTPEGKVINIKNIAQYYGIERYDVVEIDSNLNVNIKTIVNEWDKNAQKLLSSTILEYKSFILTSDGTITSRESPSNNTLIQQQEKSSFLNSRASIN